MNRKPRLLMCNEASYLSTGFATYGRQLLTRLHDSDRYEVAEFGLAGNANDPRQAEQIEALPWLFYTNTPRNDEENKIFHQNLEPNKHGAWKFDSIVLDFKPDVVFSVLDPWMIRHTVHSPLRKCYALAQMPTVDAIPLMEDWVADYLQCDAVFAYTDWGLRVIDEVSGGAMRTQYSAPGGVDERYFKPVENKAKHKEKYGLNAESFIIGMVARNQPRKLFPHLLENFKLLLDSLPDKVAQRVYLYLHTSHPDTGWDLPRLLNRFGVGHKVCFTYYCVNCQHVNPALYTDVRSFCPKCHQFTFILPNHIHAIPHNIVAEIHNLFDVYTQFAICEGLGIPLVEASHCGVPISCVNYSGMEDFVNRCAAIAIDPAAYYVDKFTDRYMAIPDKGSFIREMTRLINMPSSMLRNLGSRQRALAQSIFTWEDTTSKWMKYFDGVPLFDRWSAPPRIHNIPNGWPQNLSAEGFVNWCLLNVADRPDLLNSYTALQTTKELIWGFNQETKMQVTEELIFNEMRKIGENKNFWESQRSLCHNK